MRLRGLILDPNTESPVLILREAEGGGLFLPIWIGAFEANAIALAVEGIQPPRPLTHDLLRATLEALGGKLERVEVHDLSEGTFYARLVVSSPTADLTIDARPSDAIALALRVEAPIWTARRVLDAALENAKAITDGDEERIREWLEKATPEDLGKYSM
jgi:bifunctional DNase/RNase